MSDPLHRTILLFDIEQFSHRDDVEQEYLRRMLFDITDRAEERAGIDKTQRLRADRGDCVMELIDAGSSVPALLRVLINDVPGSLHTVNRLASSSAQIGLRAVVATGYVKVDAHDGWVGRDLNEACRLLDADLLRTALRERESGFVLCVSQGVYEGIVRNDLPGIPKSAFRSVTLDSKNGPLRAWLHEPVPGQGGGTAHTTAGHEPSPADAAPAGGVSLSLGDHAHIGESIVAGDQYRNAGPAHQDRGESK